MEEQYEVPLLKILRGNTNRFVVQLASGSTPVNLSNIERVKCSIVDALTKSKIFDAIAFVSDAVAGEVEVVFSKEQTEMLTVGQLVCFDFKLEFANGEVVNLPSPPFYGIALDAVTI